MYFVFDIESVPDFDLLRDLIDNQDQDDDMILELATEEFTKNKNGFLPPMYQQMVSWVGLWIDNQGNPKQKASWTGTNEKQGLIDLCNTLNTYKDFGLIHHNGRGFDLPLITYRAMKHGLQLPLRLNNHEIKYRFSKENIDLIDQFSNFGASSWPKLKHIGTLIGIPVKKTGEGNQVLAMYRDGEFAKIERYCYEDVVGTYLVWLHLKYTVGDMNKEYFDNLRERALMKLTEIQENIE
ncbi:MAG: ribonuclease H-like domain-containing protein [Balneolales bacterium]